MQFHQVSNFNVQISRKRLCKREMDAGGDEFCELFRDREGGDVGGEEMIDLKFEI
jgi:hypothetical protein